MERSEINQEDYLYKAAQPPEEMYQQLLAIVERSDDHYIKNLLLNILRDEEIARRLKDMASRKEHPPRLPIGTIRAYSFLLTIGRITISSLPMQ